jgi:hypothetical protein
MRELKDPNANTNGIDGHTDTEHATSNKHDPSNPWLTPGSAAFDFRSTVPPLLGPFFSTLIAIIHSLYTTPIDST